MRDKIKKKILDRKWKRLEAQGIKRPKDPQENQERIREAHVGKA